MELTDKFEYDDCKNKSKYQIKHEQIPIKLSDDLREAIYYLLWYVPNISSEQSSVNELLLNKQYDDYLFLELMEAMNLKDEDVLFTEHIEYEQIKPFLEEVCTETAKLILTISNNETKVMALLRHIRNAIAHGNFNVIDKVLLGFDIKKYDKEIEYRGFFKIDPKNLLKALKKVQFDYNSQELVKQAFRKCGYFIETYENKYEKRHEFELFARKNDKKYAIDIKNYEYDQMIKETYINDLITEYEGLIKSITPILIIHSSYLTKASKKELLKHDVIILDVKNIKKMIAGRDMVSEIQRYQEFKLTKKMDLWNLWE